MKTVAVALVLSLWLAFPQETYDLSDAQRLILYDLREQFNAFSKERSDIQSKIDQTPLGIQAKALTDKMNGINRQLRTMIDQFQNERNLKGCELDDTFHLTKCQKVGTQ